MIARNNDMTDIDSEVFVATGFSTELASGRLDGIAVPVDCAVLSLFFFDKMLGPRVHEYILEEESAELICHSLLRVVARIKVLKESK